MADPSIACSLSEEDAQRLDDFHAMLQTEAANFVGYPCNGRFDYADLFRFLSFPINNVGTTMKGAVDDIAGIRRIFDDLAIQSHYIHADAALSGLTLPFVDDPQPWDFSAPRRSVS